MKVISWLAGAWCAETSDGHYWEEHWAPPAEDCAQGIGRELDQNGNAVFVESMFVDADGKLYMTLGRPNRETVQPRPFEKVELTEVKAEWKREVEDFPQVIRYERLEADAIDVTLEGPGAARVVMHFRRITETG